MSYIMNTADDRERARLDAQAQLWDPDSIRWLTDAGVTPGAVVAEVGAGAGSIADWMCRTVGPSGRVLATDIAPSQVSKLG
jgi:tRNA A58 N-methylase Trm61